MAVFERVENILVFDLPGREKSHLVAAIARELVMNNNQSVFLSILAN